MAEQTAELETVLELTSDDITFHGRQLQRKVFTDSGHKVFGNVPFINVAHTAAIMGALYDAADGAPIADSFQYEAAIGDVIRFAGQVISSDRGDYTLPGTVDVVLVIGDGTARSWGGKVDLPPGNYELDRATAHSGETLEFELTATIDEIPTEQSYVYVVAGNTMSPAWPNDLGILGAELLVQSAPEPEPEPEPDPEPEPEPGAAHHEALARRVAAHLDRAGDESVIDLALGHVEIIESYVYGYTRGAGFSDQGEPNRALSNVIVAATAKLTHNPEQVSYYQAGDYSERPMQLQGWTLMEQAVLNNYRRRWA